jgi:preprotein translocase subunit SecD
MDMNRTLILLLILAACGCIGCNQAAKPVVEFRLAESEPTAGATETTLPLSGETIYIHREIALSDADIESAAATVRDDGKHAVEIVMTEAGSAKWAQVTGENIGKRVAMYVHGQLRLAPVIKARIAQGRAILTGEFTAEEAASLAEQLNRQAGAF